MKTAETSHNTDTHTPERQARVGRRGVWVAISATVVAAMLAAGVWLYWRHQLTERLDALAADPSEQALEAFLAGYPDTHVTDPALDLYMGYMDSIVTATTHLHPNDASPLVRMQHFATTHDLPVSVKETIMAGVDRHADEMYRKAAATGDLDAWMLYQSMVPERLLRDSDEKIDSLERNVWSTEAGAWESASRIDSRDALARYLDRYPHGRHAVAAERRLIDLEVNSYRSHGRDIVGALEKIADRDIPGAQVCIYNNSEYAVTFLFSGATSQRLHIQPHAYEEIDLADGTYKVLARIDNAAHDRFGFEQKLTHGIYTAAIEISHK